MALRKERDGDCQSGYDEHILYSAETWSVVAVRFSPHLPNIILNITWKDKVKNKIVKKRTGQRGCYSHWMD